jgi:hypothetical protein
VSTATLEEVRQVVYAYADDWVIADAQFKAEAERKDPEGHLERRLLIAEWVEGTKSYAVLVAAAEAAAKRVRAKAGITKENRAEIAGVEMAVATSVEVEYTRTASKMIVGAVFGSPEHAMDMGKWALEAAGDPLKVTRWVRYCLDTVAAIENEDPSLICRAVRAGEETIGVPAGPIGWSPEVPSVAAITKVLEEALAGIGVKALVVNMGETTSKNEGGDAETTTGQAGQDAEGEGGDPRQEIDL